MKITVYCCLLMLSSSVLATTAQMKATLVQVIHQLQVIKPELQRAAQQQPKNPRIKVHFTAWRDSQGQWHHGVIDDVNAMEQSLIAIVNQKQVAPRVVQPLAMDFTH